MNTISFISPQSRSTAKAKASKIAMTEFDLWTFNSKVFPAIETLVAATGERVRIRVGNLSMHEHPIHLHGVQFEVTGGDGGPLPPERWRTEVTELVAVGQMRASICAS